ncbi:hypothetical protein [Streptomyces sp. MBT84]|uniref:hypothetical protein n=1 Tax=Streptomyces sp. MBT84 TaxID=1488414 RepID=UPI001C6F49B5|nr:hypothetical protein [Streptomyces sp. MBT84]
MTDLRRFSPGRRPCCDGRQDEPGELQPLLTFGEVRALHYVAHLLGLRDAAAADAAREMEVRLERRLNVMSPNQNILLKSVRYD